MRQGMAKPAPKNLRRQKPHDENLSFFSARLTEGMRQGARTVLVYHSAEKKLRSPRGRL